MPKLLKKASPLLSVAIASLLLLNWTSTRKPLLCHGDVSFLEAPPDMTLIAHAAGGLDIGDYSNSREAFDQSVRRGFTLLEMDFNRTAEGKLVLIHDWGASYRYWFDLGPLQALKSLGNLPPEEKEFISLNMSAGLHQMTLDDLVILLRRNPQIRIITDIKDNNVAVLAEIAEAAGVMKNRFIPQIYSPEEHEAAVKLGYDSVIFTLYRSNLTIEEVIAFASAAKLFAITLPAHAAIEGWAAHLAQTGVPVFSHTINRPDLAALMNSIGVTGVYTDCLVPAIGGRDRTRSTH